VEHATEGVTPAASTIFKLLKQNSLKIFGLMKLGTNQVQLCGSDLASH
jgi:hypothetical protein